MRLRLLSRLLSAVLGPETGDGALAAASVARAFAEEDA